MTVLHSGSNKKFAAGWEAIFSGGRKSSRTAKSKVGATAAKGTKSKQAKSAARAGKKAK